MEAATFSNNARDIPEEHDVTVENGLFYLELGPGEGADAGLQEMFRSKFNGQPLWLELTINRVPMEPRIALRSVAYAMRAGSAETSDNVGGLEPGDIQPLITETCQPGQAIRAIDAMGGVTCETNLQSRVTGTCLSGQAMRAIDAMGGVTCETNLQSRVIGQCLPGEAIRVVHSNGDVTCEVDNDSGGDITGISTGGTSGLSGGCSSGTCNLSASGIRSSHIQDNTITGSDINTSADIQALRFRTRDNQGRLATEVYRGTNDDGSVSGHFSTYHPSASNQRISHVGRLRNHPDGGGISVQHMNDGDLALAGMYVDSNGVGNLFGTATLVVQPVSSTNNAVYSCIGGAETAIYVRGTAQLVNGSGHIELPTHFRLSAAEDGMTAVLTPHSSDSLGLARVSLTLDSGLTVKELQNGKGNYAFDYEIKAVRKGHEQYSVIRSSNEFQVDYVSDED